MIFIFLVGLVAGTLFGFAIRPVLDLKHEACKHEWDAWVEIGDGQTRNCKLCNYKEVL